MNPYQAGIAGFVLYLLGGFTSFVNLCVHLTSWIILPKWRTFKNYVYLNIIISFCAVFFLPIALFLISDFNDYYNFTYIFVDLSINFFTFSSCCWLMVLSMVFYADLVKVFGGNTTRKYLKSNAFAWGMPAAVTAVKIVDKIVLHDQSQAINYWDIFHEVYLYEELGQNGISIVLLLVNLLVYVKVVLSLLKYSNLRKSRRNQGMKIQVATLAFVMSGVLLMISILMTLLMLLGDCEMYYLYPLSLAIWGLQTSVINVCCMMARSNRRLWHDYFQNRYREHLILNEVSHF